jgi:hypothetical protein
MILASADPGAPAIAIIAMVTEGDFEVARAALEELMEYADYEDYRDSRESLQIGLTTSGLDAVIVPLGLSSLLEWRKMSRQVIGDAHDLWIATMQ